MIPHDKTIVHGSDDPDWGTPIEMYCALDAEFNFALDLAASQHNHKGGRWIGPGGIWDNCITFPEYERYRGKAVFINPPYSRELRISIVPFMTMCAVISQMFGVRVVGVIPASIQTRWWYSSVWCHASDIRLIPHRVNFDASPRGLQRINEKLVQKGKQPVAQAWNAGGNTAVVIWDQDIRRRRIGNGTPFPFVEYWSYRENWEQELAEKKE